MSKQLLIGKSEAQEIYLESSLANRHGLIAGATGTGKTVTLQRMAQAFSDIGVPVFLSDVKGDLSGLSKAGLETPRLKKRLDDLALNAFAYAANPVVFWDVFGKMGHPIRATISDMGPLMLSRLLDLNSTQQGVLELVFKIADDKKMYLIDLKDLQSMLKYVAENAKDFQLQYGNISAASVGAIQRSLLSLEQQGAVDFFGQPMLNIHDFIQTDTQGKGVVNILAANQLMTSPKLYAIFLLWLLSELFENLPEVGDLEKPKLVFFFDEAHLLFNDAPKALVEKIEQVVRLIRSKGVGIYFITQNPLDLPETVLGQLGNRVQHALRAFTPKDQKAVKTAATTMRANPKIDIETAITELAVGEALISFLQKDGVPSVTQRVLIIPPASQIGPIELSERNDLIKKSVIYGHYENKVDGVSAFEQITDLKNTQANEAVQETRDKKISESKTKSQAQSVGEAMLKTTARTVANEVGRQIIRGLLGGIFGGRR